MKTFIGNYSWILVLVITFLIIADTKISLSPLKISMKSAASAIGYLFLTIGLILIIGDAKIKAKHEGVLQGMEEMTNAISEEIKNDIFLK